MLDPISAPDLRTGAYALSVDVEDYFQVWAFSDVIHREDWPRYEYRAGVATRACLDLLDRFNLKATFFTLGWIAARDAALIREIVGRGHELASHGFDHTKVNEQGRAAFFDDIDRTRKLLEDIGGVRVNGYRAPGFSIGSATPWAYDALVEAGYRYSSSLHPIAHDHYGDPTAPQAPFRPVAGSDFIEAPVATTRIAGRRVSCAGGGWFRAMPARLSRSLLRKAGREAGPTIFYFHPWEVDPDQPRIDAARAPSKLRHYLNLQSNARKLERVLPAFAWARLDETLGLSVGAPA